jgi:hypothetical protein
VPCYSHTNFEHDPIYMSDADYAEAVQIRGTPQPLGRARLLPSRACRWTHNNRHGSAGASPSQIRNRCLVADITPSLPVLQAESRTVI